MDKIQALQEKLGGIVDKMRAMLDLADNENRDMTVDEIKVYDGFDAEIEAIKAQIKRVEKIEAIEAPLPRQTKPASIGKPVIHTAYRHAPLKAFKGENASKNAYDAGRWLQATLLGHGPSVQYCADHNLPIRSAMDIQNAHSEGVNTKGGFLVPDEMDRTIIDLREEYGVARQECRISPMASDTKTQSRRTGGLTAYFIGEGNIITESDKSWDQIKLVAKKLAALTRMSSELNEDAVISLGDDFAREMAYAFAEKEDDCLFNGDGTSTYGGIYGVRPKIIDGTHTAGAVDVSTATHNLFSEIDAADLLGMMAVLPRYAERNAKFYCSKLAYTQVFQRLTSALGGNTISDVEAGTGLNYLGHPVVISQSMPGGAATDYNNLAMILFGDMSMAATMGTRRGTTVAISEHHFFDTDEIAVRGTERFDINVHDLGDTSTAGPIVALIGSSS